MTTIKLRRGLSTAFSTNNPVLAAGEPAFATDTGILKIGDGTTAYNSLPSIGASPDLTNYVTTNTAQTISATKTFSANQNIGSIQVDCRSPIIRPTGTMSFRRDASSSSSDAVGIRFNAADNTNGGVACGVHSSSSYKGGLLLYTNSTNPYKYYPSIMFSPHGTPDSLNADITCYNNTALNVRATTVNIGEATSQSSGTYTGLRIAADGSLLEYNNKNVLLDGDAAAIDFSNTTDQAKILMGSMAMPSDKSINLTLGASGSTYIAPANGYYRCYIGGQSGNKWLKLYTSAGYLQEAGFSTNSNIGFTVPIQKGQTLHVKYSGTLTISGLVFIYAQGSESEA